MSEPRAGRMAAGEDARRLLRIGPCRVSCAGPADAIARALGPLAALEGAGAPTAAPPALVALRVRWDDATTSAGTAAGTLSSETRYVASGPASTIVARGRGEAMLSPDGALDARLPTDAPEGDAVAESVTIPALAERLRRDGVRLVHGAVLLAPDRRTALLVPAARGGGKTTLSLSLRRHGWTMLSDDRAWLGGDPAAAWVDAWPEAPRVGDRSLFLVPPGLAAGPRDARTGKAPVPGLTPPRLPDPVPLGVVALPRLVPGRGGEVRRIRGAAALAPVLSQCVVATDPATAAATMRFVADLLGRLPLHEVDVGDDPAALASASDALASSARQRS